MLIGILVLAAMLGLFVLAVEVTVRRARRARRPRPGELRITGTVVAIETIAAPITKRACVFVQAGVELEAGMMLTESRGVAFFVEDSARRILVDPTDAQAVFTSASVVGPPRSVRDEVVADPGGWGSRYAAEILKPSATVLRFVEMRIEPSAVITVSGTLIEAPDPDRGAAGGLYRDGGPVPARLVGTAEHPLAIWDHPVA